MPRSAIFSGAVDIIESPDGMAEAIIKISHLFPLPPVSIADAHKPEAGEQAHLHRIFMALLHATGVDFTLYKQSTIHRRIVRRMFLVKVPDLATYARYLARHPEELKELFEEVLIQVTGFFRDPEGYEVLQTRILPAYLKGWNRTAPLRIWVVGCSSGEEAYSIAITFFELLDEATVHPEFQIFASDISERAIAKARAGVYPEDISKDVSQDRLRRFFTKEDHDYRIAKFVRDTCLFEIHRLRRSI